MLFLLALLGLAFAGNDESKCALDFLNGDSESYDECEMEDEIDNLISQSQKCWTALGKCQGGGGGGGAIAPMGLVVAYGNDKRFGFGFSSKFPLGAAFDEIHRRALVNLEMDDDHDLTFDFSFSSPKVSGKVSDDDSLETAVLSAQRLKQLLILTAHKTTLSPTPEPTNPWGQSRTVKQVYGNVADGRDTGIPGTGDVNKQRVLKFIKADKLTQLRLQYKDNVRVYNNGGVCYWEMYIDGKRCKGGTPGIIRGGMHSQGNDNNDHQVTNIIGITQPGEANLYAEGEHTWDVRVSGNGRDCYTGWDGESKSMFMMEVKEVMPNRYGFLTWKTHYGIVRPEDNALPIVGREISFVKEEENSILRLSYFDNLRVYNGGSCRWYFRIDKAICDGNKWIAQSIHTHGNENDHIPTSFMGYCKAVKAGAHKFQVGVNASNDCYTGWESHFHMEVRELYLQDASKADEKQGSRIYMFQRHGNGNADGRDNGYINYRILNFKKWSDTSLIRFTYSDNLRVHGHGKWCKWELRIDQKQPCTQNISGAKYVVKNQNDHGPNMIVGYCKGLPAKTSGTGYKLQVHVKGNSADCYTGWDRQTQGSFTMEAEEIDGLKNESIMKVL